MEIEGLIISDLGSKEGISKAGNPWKKHEWLLETAGQFPRKVKFTVFGERTNTITFECGKRYVIQVDVESREYNGNWFTDLTAYSSRMLEDGVNAQGPVYNPNAGVQTQPASQPVAAAQPAPQNPFSKAPSFELPQEDNDNLPF